MSHSAKRKREANVAIRSSLLPEFLERLEIVAKNSAAATDRLLAEMWPSSSVMVSDYDQLSYSISYLHDSIMSKFDDGKPAPERTQTTWERFYKAEEACLYANRRLSQAPALSLTTGVGVWSYIETARRKIAWLLGDYSADKVMRGNSFTSGASYYTPRREGDSAYKFSGPPETTVDNLPVAANQICSSDLWCRALGQDGYFRLAPGNKLICVPKNVKTDRMIAIEPSMNMYVQKGIGSYIRHRLKRVQVDLDSQKRSQELAFRGSVNGDVATIDLSMASDTVSYEIVRQLLPPDWFCALEQCRSRVGVLPSGKKVVYRKFSSMGNGYTFELETMIFWALAWAVNSIHDGDMSLLMVYGDDITVDVKTAELLMDLLSFCGFTTNAAKTHIDGGFRESCGKHYYYGHDVTPFYVRRPVTKLDELFKLHNKLYRWVMRNWARMPSDIYSEYVELLSWLRSEAPAGWRRPRIPDGLGDGAFIGTFDECQPSKPAASAKKFAGWEGWLVDVLATTTETGIPVDGALVYTRTGKPVRRKVKSNLDQGYLLSKLHRSRPSGWEASLFPDDVLGGLSLGQRTRVITILVPQFGSIGETV